MMMPDEMTLELLDSYDKVIFMYSGGKDSTADVLYLKDLGVPIEKMELWHHEIDGRDGQFMDWPITPAYCEAFAKAMGIPIYFSWRQGGFLREMLRDNQSTAPVAFESPSGMVDAVRADVQGGKGPKGTRLKFPQVSASLRTRWCSAALKIDVADIALKNQMRFRGIKTLVVTGERAQESPSRAKYKVFEPHRSDLRNGKKYQRHIDHWRPVHAWKEEKVWDIIKQHKINVHPAYHLGWGRLSCMTCIFGSCNQWASCNMVALKSVSRIIDYETKFKCTIHRKESVLQRLLKGEPYEPTMIDPINRDLSQSDVYDQEIFIESEWTLPAGAFGESDGPT